MVKNRQKSNISWRKFAISWMDETLKNDFDCSTNLFFSTIFSSSSHTLVLYCLDVNHFISIKEKWNFNFCTHTQYLLDCFSTPKNISMVNFYKYLSSTTQIASNAKIKKAKHICCFGIFASLVVNIVNLWKNICVLF